MGHIGQVSRSNTCVILKSYFEVSQTALCTDIATGISPGKT